MKKKIITIQEEYIKMVSSASFPDGSFTFMAHTYFKEPYTTEERQAELINKAMEQYAKYKADKNSMTCHFESPEFYKYWETIVEEEIEL